jgi:replicative DNA helicase
MIPIPSEKICSIEIEQFLLGAILCKPGIFSEVVGIVEEGQFFEPLHGEIFGVIRQMIADGRGVSSVLAAQYFNSEAEITKELTVRQYLGRLAASVPSLISAKDYALTVRDYSNRRKLILAGEDLVEAALDPKVGVSEAASEGVQRLDEVISSARPGKPTRRSLSGAVADLISALDAGKSEKPITTGLADLDKVIGGWKKGEYHIIAARPSMGKSALAACTMLSAARAGHGTMLFSLEMTQKAVAARCMSDFLWNSITPLPYSDILKERLDDRQRERLREAAGRFREFPVVIDDQAGLTIAEIAAKARQQAARFARDGRKLDLLIIDHLGKVRASKRYAGNLVAETGEVSNALAGLAKELDVAMVALHQLNRAVEGRDDKHPQLSDLRNSGDIEQDADVIGFLYRPAYYLERAKYDSKDLESQRVEALARRRNDLEILIGKNRNGPCITIEAFIDAPCNAIRNAVRG